jgi:hypothetical protein
MVRLTKLVRTAFAAAGLLALGQGAYADVTVSNAGFEDAPVLSAPTKQYVYDPVTPSSWTYTGNSGLAIVVDGAVPATTPFGVLGSNAANGNQVAFLQNTMGVVSTISQTVTSTAGFFAITFDAEARNYSANKINPTAIEVLVDGNVVFSGLPNLSGLFGSITTNGFLFTAGTHTLTFETTGPATQGDSTTFIDNISSVNAVPEPSQLVLAGVAAIGGLGAFYRKRKAAKASA